MEFFIKKGATLPLLKLNIIDNGRNDYNSFLNTIELSSLFFSMTNVDTGIPKIMNKPAGVGIYNSPIISGVSQYYIYYQFQNTDTTREGRFEGEFILKNDDGVLVLTLGEKLYINITDSFIIDDVGYSSCYVIDYACCNNGSPLVITSPTPTPTQTVTPTPTQTVTPTPTQTVTPTPTQTVTPTPTITTSITPSVTVTPTITNSVTPTATTTQTPTPTPSSVSSIILSLGFDSLDAAVACGNYYTTPSNYYVPSSQGPTLHIGDKIYTGSSLTTLSSLGFYSDGTYYYEYCDNSGNIEICFSGSCG